MHKHKMISVLFVTLLIFGLLLSGCTQKTTNTSSNTPTTPSTPSNSNPTPSPSNTTTPEPEKKDNWPDKPITWIVPFDAGGSVDTMARTLAPFMQEKLGVPIVIDNRPGANGQLGATVFYNSPDDGSYFFVGTQPYLSTNVVLQNAPFKMSDFSMINYEQYDPISILVHKDAPWNNVGDFIEAVRKDPNKYTWGTIVGGAPYVYGLAFFDALGLQVRPVFYTGGSGYRTAILGHQVDFATGTAAGDLAIKDNAKILGVADTKSYAGWPDAKPFNEQLKQYGVEVPNLGSARFVAVHTSFKEKYPERYDKFVKAYKEVLDSPEYKAKTKEIGVSDITQWIGPEASEKMNKDLTDLILKYKDKMTQ